MKAGVAASEAWTKDLEREAIVTASLVGRIHAFPGIERKMLLGKTWREGDGRGRSVGSC